MEYRISNKEYPFEKFDEISQRPQKNNIVKLRYSIFNIPLWLLKVLKKFYEKTRLQ